MNKKGSNVYRKQRMMVRSDRDTFIKSASLIEAKELIKLRTPFSKEAIDALKSAFPVRQYHGNGKVKYWTVPLTLESCALAKKLGYSFSKDLKQWINEHYFKNRINKKTFSVPGLNGTLFDYQKLGIAYTEEKNGRALIADDMGLGKTIQGLGYIQLHRTEGTFIVVCPSSVKYNWQDEATEWLPGIRTLVLEGQTVETINDEYDIIIINFDIVQYWLDELKKLNIRGVIVDEIHYIKNNGTKKRKVKRTKAVKMLCKGVPSVIGLSGTPIENKPSELYNIIHIINNKIFPNEWYYKQRYCGAKHNGFGWTFNGASNTRELNKILKDRIMIRRLKKDVLKELPDKLYSFVPLMIDNWKEYKQAEEDFINYIYSMTELEVRKALHKYFFDDLEGTVDVVDHKLERLQQERAEKANPLSQMAALKKLVAEGKLNQIIEWVEDFIETGKKLVLFCNHVFIIDRFMEEFKGKIVKIDGTVPTKGRKRQDIVKKFQEDKNTKIFIGNKAAEVGITLTAASDVGIIEYPDKPGALKQRIDRTHRIGQKNTVNVWYFTGKNTIDEKIAHMLDEKQRMIEGVLDGKEPEIDENLLLNILNSYRE